MNENKEKTSDTNMEGTRIDNDKGDDKVNEKRTTYSMSSSEAVALAKAKLKQYQLIIFTLL